MTNPALPKPVIFLLIGLAIMIYVGFNIWLFSAHNISPKTSMPSLFNNFNKAAKPNQSRTSVDAPPQLGIQTSSTPIPTPTPLQGPGQYACAPSGDCADYSETMRKSCAVTFADRNCLGECNNPSLLCTH